MTSPVTIRRIEASDFDAADRVLRTAFGQPHSFLPNMCIACAIEPDGFLVALERGRIVGSVAAVDYGQLAYIGFMAVEPALQSRGIGRLLIERLLAWLDARGCPVVLLDATPQGARLYETLGFVDDAVAAVYERDAAPMAGAGGRSGASEFSETVNQIRAGTAKVQLAANCDLAEIAAFDAEHFGANRLKLLAALWPEHRPRCLVARNATGGLEGYLFARDPVLGPWLATSAEVADALLTQALDMADSLPSGRAPLVMVPRSNDEARALLAARGFHEQRQLRHMRRGAASPGKPATLYGQSSFAHG